MSEPALSGLAFWCKGCGQPIGQKDLDHNNPVCPYCGKHPYSEWKS